MGHNISGLVAKRAPLIAAVAAPWVVAPLAQGFGLAVRDNLGAYPGSAMPPEVLDIVTILKDTSPLAFIMTDYFGGEGSQAAAAWKGDETQALRQGDGAINQALRYLGVQKGSQRDEFDALGLDWHRSNDDWIEFARNGKLSWQREPWPAAYTAWTEHNKIKVI